MADDIAYFDMFFRRVPDGGGYAIMAGLEQVIDYLKKACAATEDTKCVYLHRKSFKGPEERRVKGLIESLGLELIGSKDLDPIDQ